MDYLENTIYDDQNTEQTNADSSSSSDSDNEEEDDIPVFPTSSSVLIQHGTKSLSCLTTDLNGTRMITGGYDGDMEMFDFGSMDSSFKPFRTIQPCQGKVLKSIEYSSNADMILIVSGDCQAKVVNREASGKQIIYKCPLGDGYVVDMNRTKGHKSMLNYGCWSPTDKNEFMTCSDDCTIRLWSLNNREQQISCIRTKSEQGHDVRTTTCTYHSIHQNGVNTSLVAGGCLDGSIQIWDRRKPFVHTTFLCRHAHQNDEIISSLKWSYDGLHLASRSTDHTLKLWDIRMFEKGCLSSCENIHNRFAMTNVCFSPNDRYLITGMSKKTNVDLGDETDENIGKLLIFDRLDLHKPVEQISMMNDSSVIRTFWHPKLNQIFCTTNNGCIKIFYDTQKSMNGVLSCLNRQPKKQKQTNDFYANIDLDAVKSNAISSITSRHRKQRQDPVQSKRPEVPTDSTGHDGRLGEHGSTLHQHIVKNIELRKVYDDKEDPREEILKYAQIAEEQPFYVTPAYKETQPNTIFQADVDEDEEEELVQPWKKQKN